MQRVPPSLAGPGTQSHAGNALCHKRMEAGEPGLIQPAAIRFAGLAQVLRRRGDRQLPADRLASVLAAVRVDERSHVLGRRSSSAWAKYADALRRISFARPSSRFSLSSALSRSRSSLVSPGRTPESRSARRTHLRSVSAEHPTCDDTATMAAHASRARPGGPGPTALPVPEAPGSICLNVSCTQSLKVWASEKPGTVQGGVCAIRR